MTTDKTNSNLLSKLKVKLDRMLGRKKSEPLDLTYKPQKSCPSARKSFRIDVDNMHLICRSPRIKCRILDISATGIGFVSSKEFPPGDEIEAIILWSGKAVLKNIKMKIVRHEGKIIGCEFQDLERVQDKIISKIVLAAQQRQIEKKHNATGKDKIEAEVAKEAARIAKIEHAKKTTTKKIKL
ncbi:PilZ domain-containing protein [Maridesulfovibrio hydrothermalis]|uniref:Type IV pilus assembly PilZ n=1 Tax=Maridesulfovibrio hydrothermalis AM13 = DSM 14728 TaxID=1121451 RepID=L0RHE9_9BACT|nr:PilZ domain-containing protein [Maridesulfovibrio hydrothermalis]CCO24991.1 Type IV pilus assembly PilZ [Maridesulfovibrio hydrothermalis AM13 = DSM 14728]